MCIRDRAQAKTGFENLKTILTEAGVSFENVVKTTVFLTDMNDFAAVNDIYAQYFTGEYPARSCVQVAAPVSYTHLDVYKRQI